MTATDTPRMPTFAVLSEATGVPKELQFATASFPAISADMVASMVHTPEITRFFFGRLEPEMFGRAGQRISPVLEVTMPLSGFANMAIFFNAQLEAVILENPQLAAIVTEMRKQHAANTAAQQNAQETK